MKGVNYSQGVKKSVKRNRGGYFRDLKTIKDCPRSLRETLPGLQGGDQLE